VEPVAVLGCGPSATPTSVRCLGSGSSVILGLRGLVNLDKTSSTTPSTTRNETRGDTGGETVIRTQIIEMHWSCCMYVLLATSTYYYGKVSLVHPTNLRGWSYLCRNLLSSSPRWSQARNLGVRNVEYSYGSYRGASHFVIWESIPFEKFQ
jgi:hypothetical protein